MKKRRWTVYVLRPRRKQYQPTIHRLHQIAGCYRAIWGALVKEHEITANRGVVRDIHKACPQPLWVSGAVPVNCITLRIDCRDWKLRVFPRLQPPILKLNGLLACSLCSTVP